MIRFQCSHCRGIVAAETWEPGAITTCAYCSKEVAMPEDRLAPRAVLGDFLLVRKLGAGGMGVVYLAHQLSLDRPAAIKVLNSEYSHEAEAVQAFIREARSAAKLNHPNIVQAYAVGEEDGIFFFAMEYIDGKTMKEVLLAEKKIEFRRAAEIIMQVADALDCAWREQKLIHHDIKPDNIMQCANKRVKLADLGLSQVFGEDADSDSNEVIGTPQYISPEQLTGTVTDTRSDIYSLGATFYHFVTGQFPYNAEKSDDIAKQHVYGTLTPPKQVNADLPQVLNDIIVKMMAKQPEYRFQDCAELSKALKDYLAQADRAPIATAPVNTLTGAIGGIQTTSRIINPPASGKLTLKIADSVKSAQAASAPTSAAPVITPPAGGGIKLKIGGTAPAAPAPAESAPASTPAASASAAAPAIIPPAAGGGIKLKTKAAPEPPAPAAEEKAAPEEPEKAEASPAEAEEKKSVALEEVSAEKTAETSEKTEEKADENKDADNAAETEKNAAETKSSGSSRGTLIGVVLAVLLLGGGGYGYHLYQKKQLEKEEKAPVEKVQLIQAKEAKSAVQNSGNTPTPEVVETPQEEKTVRKVLSKAMQELKRMEELSLSNGNAFLSTWPQACRSIKAVTAEEKRIYATLDAHYVDVDESKRVEPVRNAMIANFKKQVDALAKSIAAREHQLRIRQAEEQAFKLAEESAENYQADLQRKMGLLDYAMLTASKSKRPADWKKFEAAVALAKAEPQRVASREGFKSAAEELAVYAEHLENVVRQGKAFTELLVKRTLRNKSISDKNAKVTILNTSLTMLQMRVQILIPEAPKVAKPKAAAKKPAAKGKGKAKPKPQPKAKPKLPKPKVLNVQLLTMPVTEVAQKVRVIETMIGKRDQYFYYMLYNGHLRQKLSAIAPDAYWKKHVDQVAVRYFRRAVFLANAQQLAALKKTYGQWQSFQDVLKEFEAGQ